MKKFGFIVAAMAVAGFAFASSLAVPWFIDQPITNVGLPPTAAGIMGIVYLHNNLSTELECAIEYRTQDGGYLGPDFPNNTFILTPNATVAFRPGVNDPLGDATPGGQEAPTGAAIPNRPKTTVGDGDTKSNGSITITWNGAPTDVQGIYLQTQNTGTALLQWGTLLPPGA